MDLVSGTLAQNVVNGRSFDASHVVMEQLQSSDWSPAIAVLLSPMLPCSCELWALHDRTRHRSTLSYHAVQTKTRTYASSPRRLIQTVILAQVVISGSGGLLGTEGSEADGADANIFEGVHSLSLEEWISLVTRGDHFSGNIVIIVASSPVWPGQ